MHHVNHGVEPSLGVGGILGELLVGLPVFRRAVVARAGSPALAHVKLGRGEVGLGHRHCLDGLLLHRGHVFRRDGAPLAEVAEGGHGMRVRGTEANVCSGNAQLLGNLGLHPAGHLSRHAADVQRNDGRLGISEPEHERSGGGRPADAGNAAFFAGRAVEPGHLDSQRWGRIDDTFASFQPRAFGRCKTGSCRQRQRRRGPAASDPAKKRSTPEDLVVFGFHGVLPIVGRVE